MHTHYVFVILLKQYVCSLLNQITELAGYTYRVWEMFEVFNQVSEGNYIKSALEDSKGKKKNSIGNHLTANLEIKGAIVLQLLMIPAYNTS